MHFILIINSFRPKDASEILANELENSTLSPNGSINGNKINDDMFSGFTVGQPKAAIGAAIAPAKAREQLK